MVHHTYPCIEPETEDQSILKITVGLVSMKVNQKKRETLSAEAFLLAD
jgi:hypothetical protein